jgi:ribosome recycling factor
MTNDVLKKAQAAFDKAIDHLKHEYMGLQTGRASSQMVDSIKVDSYGVSQPIKAVASVSVPDARMISIQPWDKGLLGAIEKAIQNSDLNLNPTNNGTSVILNIPPLTEERRRDLVKVVGRLAEEARISVRNARQDAMSTIKRLQHDGDITEDDKNRSEKQLQDKVDSANSMIAETAKSKEEQVMTV